MLCILYPTPTVAIPANAVIAVMQSLARSFANRAFVPRSKHIMEKLVGKGKRGESFRGHVRNPFLELAKRSGVNCKPRIVGQAIGKANQANLLAILDDYYSFAVQPG
jgi:hypothetical protein